MGMKITWKNPADFELRGSIDLENDRTRPARDSEDADVRSPAAPSGEMLNAGRMRGCEAERESRRETANLMETSLGGDSLLHFTPSVRFRRVSCVLTRSRARTR
jgi:hypothetical protein